MSEPEINADKTSVHDPYEGAPTTEAATIAALSNPGAPIAVHGLGVEGMILTRDGKGIIERWDEEPWSLWPRRAKGTQQILTEVAFGDYVNLHLTDRRTVVYAEEDMLRLTAVFNEHEQGVPAANPGWRDWRAQLTMEHGKSWLAWTNIDREWQEQADFMDLLEERVDDVVAPPQTDLLDIVSNFSTHKTVAFQSAISLHDGGVRLEYKEDVTSAGGGTSGHQVMPERIELALQAIKGDAPWKVTARLRYRITDGRLRIMVLLDRLDEVLEEAWGEVVKRVDAALDCPVLEGRP